MRAYAALGADQVVELRDGGAVRTGLVVPASESDDDELAALEQAAGEARVVAAIDVDDAGASFRLSDVASFHVDGDGSGHLQWFARQEIDAVVDLLD